MDISITEKVNQTSIFSNKKKQDLNSTSFMQNIQVSRRFKKPKVNTTVDSAMLGAGADPKELRHDFSFF